MTKKDNVIDFLAGFFGIQIIGGIIITALISVMSRLQQQKAALIFIGVAWFFMYALGIGYFWGNRKYISIGIIAQLVAYLLLIAIFWYGTKMYGWGFGQ